MRSPLALLLFATALLGCSGSSGRGPPTGAVCPTDSALTYHNFAKPFMEKYCNECHSRSLRGEDRQGAPSFHDFDTLNGIRVVWDHVDMTSASGPNATNDSMPPESPTPTLEERKQLGEWLACDMPEGTPP